jgi:hypothetical protein
VVDNAAVSRLQMIMSRTLFVRGRNSTGLDAPLDVRYGPGPLYLEGPEHDRGSGAMKTHKRHRQLSTVG